MSKLADAISQLTPEQRALLEKRLREKRKQQQPATNQILQRADTTSYPLSAGQQRLWLLDQMSQKPGSITLSETLRLRGPLDLDLLQQSIAKIGQRHEILRVQFELVDGEPAQSLCQKSEFPIHFVDESSRSEPERLEHALQKVQTEKARPFNIAEAPLWRVTLIRMDEADHLFLLTMHHIISDGWSMGIFFDELSRFYMQALDKTLSQETLPAEQMAIQYADFASWQQAWLESDEAKRQLAYWESALAGELKPLTLPFESSTVGTQSNVGGQETIVFGSELTEALQRVSRQENVTLFSTLLAAFSATLYQYTAQKELLLCTPTVGRRRVEVENLIGYFNNICTLRLDNSNNPSLGELLKRTNDVVIGAYDHQDIPFQQVTRLPNLARIPLTRAFFALEDSLENALTLPDVDVELLDLGGESADFDIALYMVQTNETDLNRSGLKAYLLYREALFNRDEIADFLQNYRLTLAAIAEMQDIHLADLPPLIPTAEPAHNNLLEVEGISELALNGTSETGLYQDGTKPSLNGNLGLPIEQSTLPEPALDTIISDATESASASNASTTPPQTELETQLVRIWEDLLGVGPIGVDQDFFALGGHSMLAVHLVDEIKRQITGQTVPLSLLLQASTVAEMAAVLQNDSLGEWSPLVQIKVGDPTKPALFCVHGAGGNVLTYRELAHHLDADQPVFGLQTQGLDGKLPLHDSVEEMATLYRTHIQRAQPQGPYLLTGYCMGGTVALEIAQQLRGLGHEVGLLGLLETYNWHVMREESFWDKAYYWLQKFDFHWRNFTLLGWQYKRLFLGEKWIALKDRTKVWRGASGNASKHGDGSGGLDQNTLIAGVWANNDEVSIKYKPKAYDGTITAFTPTKEYTIYTSQDTGWGKLATHVEKKVLPVYPAGMLLEPFVATLAAEMSKSIDAALRDR